MGLALIKGAQNTRTKLLTNRSVHHDFNTDNGGEFCLFQNDDH